MLPKFSSIPVTYASVVASEQTGPSVASSSAVHSSKISQDSIDLRDLLTLPTHPASEFVISSKLKALCANHNMKGLLEVYYLINKIIVSNVFHIYDIYEWQFMIFFECQFRLNLFISLVMLPPTVRRWKRSILARIQLLLDPLYMIIQPQATTVCLILKRYITHM